MKLMKLFAAFCLLPFFAWSNGIKGKIVNAKGDPMSFAAIAVMPGNAGTLSNADGLFELNLPNGKFTIYFQFLGYQTQKKEIVIDGNWVVLNVTLQEQAYALAEVNIQAGKEDIAYSIMRKAIAMAPNHVRAIKSYEVKTYVKGSFKVLDLPWLLRKRLEKENFKVGNTYVLESVNLVTFQYPNTVNERVLSTRSNLPPGSEPTISFARTNFYKPSLGDMVSPLSPKAFGIYKFKYLGTFEDQGLSIIRIQVTPKSKGANVYEGVLSLIDHTFAIHSLKFNFTDDNGFVNQLEQLMNPYDGVWLPSKLDLKVDINYLGAKAKLNYVTSVRDYKVQLNANALNLPEIIDEKLDKNMPQDNLSPNNKVLTTKQAKKENKLLEKKEKAERKAAGEDLQIISNYSFKVDTLARTQADAIWDSLRQMPLTDEELIGYKIADSIYLANRDKLAKDSIDELPAFKLKHLIGGHTYNYGNKVEQIGYRKSLEFQSVISSIQKLDIFNTVDGFVLNSGLSYIKRLAERQENITALKLRYAINRNALMSTISHNIKRERHQFYLEGGRDVRQFNGQNPISNGANLIYTLLAERNFIKLYEEDFIKARFAGFLTDKFTIKTGMSLSERRSLDNNSNFVIFDNPNRTYTSNIPFNEFSDSLSFNTHTAFLVDAELVWRPWAKARIYNGRRITINPDYPALVFKYQGGFAQTRFDRVSIGLKQNTTIFKNLGLEYAFEAGTFLTKPSYFVDFAHPMGNQTFFIGSNLSQFRQLNYYQYSTNNQYLQAFMSLSPRKLLLSRIKSLQLMGISEQFFLNAWVINNFHYFETGYRIDGIFRVFGLDLYTGFDNNNNITWGAAIKVPF